ncbi:glutamate synthase (NADH) small subunit [Magnetococcus marinus MC-1]|uniref:Glutamate synthase (NADH) small subunit n=1 Tax=Magnetococcus marinus (strain ATCC BAA-1437 / JCM 17883 / MC-1) TaxID=156889 RepID=A0L5I5_MAGMM|nr:glutamate synthase subunit beta [Magnetococcus marinus]ABK43228.1 glutamate synthase (NADH) small subunit [Magnetococcus marinus MC-1]
MGKITGFMEFERELPEKRPVAERIKDSKELYKDFPESALRIQAARCMDCGIPFCHSGCTLCNLIPQWNDLVYRERWEDASQALHRTNNFPEFTGRICPALCEASCVVGINGEAVAIREIEKTVAEKGWQEGYIKPLKPLSLTGKRVAVIGSGPAGMACAQQLTRVGHSVTLYEKNESVGGLLRFGIPDFKLEKEVVERRVNQMKEEGLTIKTGVHVGVDLSIEQLRQESDAIVLTGGAEQPRNLPIQGREFKGIHFAMSFLAQQNRRVAGSKIAPDEVIHAAGKRVVVIGGGDTGSDCVGTSNRHGAVSVTQLELLPKPPRDRADETPWPTWPHMLRTSTSHEEGCDRMWSILTKYFEGDEQGNVKRLHCVKLRWIEQEDGSRPQMEEIAGSEFVLEADLVLLAMGFLGPVKTGLLDELGVALDARGNVKVDHQFQTSVAGVFAAGDMATGQSLVLKCIDSGRKAARGVDAYLRGGESILEP